MTDLIRYDLMVQEALRGVVRKVLTDAARDGLPGEHHFYVSFRTGAPGVKISSRLKAKYPQEMTIVLQHQFWDLTVTDQAFDVGLSFSNIPERLHVPFDALSGFFDPSVQFGLKFEPQETAAETTVVAPPTPLPAKPPASVETSKAAIPQLTRPEPAEAEPVAEDDGKVAPPKGKTSKAASDKSKAQAEAEPASGAAVVSLDAFRKKN